VVVQDGEDDDADDALTRPRKKGLGLEGSYGLASVQGVLTTLLGGADREDFNHLLAI
jgi:hypothetical protein